MSNINDNSVSCGNCGYVFHGDDLEQESGKRKPCPKCGSLKRTFYEKAEVKIRVKVGASAVHEAHMNSQSWTILGLVLAFALPPMFYAVFSVLTISFWYKLIIWLSITIMAFLLTKSYRLIMFLRFIADKAYGKSKI